MHARFFGVLKRAVEEAKQASKEQARREAFMVKEKALAEAQEARNNRENRPWPG